MVVGGSCLNVSMSGRSVEDCINGDILHTVAAVHGQPVNLHKHGKISAGLWISFISQPRLKQIGYLASQLS